MLFCDAIFILLANAMWKSQGEDVSICVCVCVCCMECTRPTTPIKTELFSECQTRIHIMQLNGTYAKHEPNSATTICNSDKNKQQQRSNVAQWSSWLYVTLLPINLICSMKFADFSNSQPLQKHTNRTHWIACLRTFKKITRTLEQKKSIIINYYLINCFAPKSYCRVMEYIHIVSW